MVGQGDGSWLGLHVYHLALSALVPLSGGLLQWCLPVVGRNSLMGAPWMSHVTMNPASGRLLLGWAIPLSWGKNLPNSVVWGVWTSGNRPKSWAERCCSCFGRTAVLAGCCRCERTADTADMVGMVYFYFGHGKSLSLKIGKKNRFHPRMSRILGYPLVI